VTLVSYFDFDLEDIFCSFFFFKQKTAYDFVLYAPFWDGNFFPFFPPVDGSPWNPAKARAFIRKITLDLGSSSDTWKEEILWPQQVVDLGKVDPRTMTLQSRYLYTSYSDPAKPFDSA